MTLYPLGGSLLCRGTIAGGKWGQAALSFAGAITPLVGELGDAE